VSALAGMLACPATYHATHCGGRPHLCCARPYRARMRPRSTTSLCHCCRCYGDKPPAFLAKVRGPPAAAALRQRPAPPACRSALNSYLCTDRLIPPPHTPPRSAPAAGPLGPPARAGAGRQDRDRVGGHHGPAGGGVPRDQAADAGQGQPGARASGPAHAPGEALLQRLAAVADQQLQPRQCVRLGPAAAPAALRVCALVTALSPAPCCRHASPVHAHRRRSSSQPPAAAPWASSRRRRCGPPSTAPPNLAARARPQAPSASSRPLWT
jgi:hypothetical protein